MSNTTAPILNPDTSLAFLTPDTAKQLEIYRYVVAASLGGYACNFLSNIQDHYRLLVRYKVTISTVAYFISILGTLIYLVGCVVFHTAHVDNCQTATEIIGAGFALAIPATTFLFLLRVCAVCMMDRRVVIVFSVLWLGTLACAVTLPFAINGTHIGPTSMGIDAGVHSFSSASVAANMVFDSLVFFTISFRLLDTTTGSTDNSLKSKAKGFIKGGTLPALPRCLLQSGQVYYLITLLVNIATTVMLLDPSVGHILHALLTNPNAAIMNMMACKVFREVKFGKYGEATALLPLTQTWRVNRPRLHRLVRMIRSEKWARGLHGFHRRSSSSLATPGPTHS